MVERYRTRSTPSSGAYKESKTYTGQPVVTAVTKASLESQVMTDTVVKDFKKLSKQGMIFNNPCSSQRITTDITGSYFDIRTITGPAGATNVGQSEYYKDYGGARLASYTGSNFPVVTLDTEGAALKAAISAMANVNATEVDVGNFAGEWHKTRRLHRDLLTALVKAFTEGVAVVGQRGSRKRIPLYDRDGHPILNRKGKPIYRWLHTKSDVKVRGKTQRVKNTANLYLTLRMGLAPLLSDLEGACKLLDDPMPERATARGSESLQGMATNIRSVPSVISGKSFALQQKTVRTWTRRAGILYETTPLTRLAARMGVTRPLTSAWNLLPWSFVVDYVLNVGKWLDAIQPTGAHRILSAWESTQETIVNTIEVSGSFTSTASNVATTNSWNGGLTRVSTWKSRTPWAQDVPKNPGLGTGISPTRSFDLAALALQRIKTIR